MILKRCEFCGKEVEAKKRTKRFCNPICQRKHYNRQPEIREKYKLRMRKFRKDNPEWKEKHRILAVTKYREQRKKYWKDYGSRPEVRKRINKKDRERRRVDKVYAIADRLRRSLNHAMTKYSKTGKIKSSKKYGIDWIEIIENLKPFPEKIEEFEIDHIIPLCKFNLAKDIEIRKAFSPSNLQWLTREENRRKSAKILKDVSILNKISLQKINKEI